MKTVLVVILFILALVNQINCMCLFGFSMFGSFLGSCKSSSCSQATLNLAQLATNTLIQTGEVTKQCLNVVPQSCFDQNAVSALCIY